MKQILLIFICIELIPLGLNAQDTLYHVLDASIEEPSVKEWNVSRQKAIVSKNYIIEVTDNLDRPVVLYFYYNGLNRRLRIDDPEIIVFMYKDGAIDIFENYSRETDYSMWANEDFRRLHYHLEFDKEYSLKDYLIYSFVDTIQRRDYFQHMDSKGDKEDFEVFLLDEYHGVEACKYIKIPYLDFLYTKNIASPNGLGFEQ